jgi:hypothetical protein
VGVGRGEHDALDDFPACSPAASCRPTAFEVASV